jgi:hypothetical protein
MTTNSRQTLISLSQGQQLRDLTDPAAGAAMNRPPMEGAVNDHPRTPSAWRKPSPLLQPLALALALAVPSLAACGMDPGADDAELADELSGAERQSLAIAGSAETSSGALAVAATPYTRITAPANGAQVAAGAVLTVVADAQDPDGISVARLWIDGVYHSLDETAPYSFSVTGLTPGAHTLVVRSKDRNDNLLDSAPVSVTVSSSGIILPIEVLGPSGTRKTVRFDLRDLTSISHLYLRCNGCGYTDVGRSKNTALKKATVRINGGPAIALTRFTEGSNVYGNTQIRIIGGEASYGGIGGAFRTVRFTVPVAGLRVGSNDLTFEHLNEDGLSIGFRILEMNLLKNGSLDQKVLSTAAFVQDDPRTWTPPRNTPTDISQGAALWNDRTKLYDGFLDSLDGEGGGRGAINGVMRTACSDCHASDGRDLKYFNFSNASIIERSKFHRLTQTQGEQIASYIRSRNLPIVTQARPWNPTYQPGPGMDGRPVYEWAAGAGINAVLDRDADMAPYLFPGGTSLDQVRAVVDRFRTLNFRALPINIPMPEWNQWLPIIHPNDAFNTSASAIRSDDRGNNVNMPYYEKIYRDAVATPTRVTLGGFSKGINDWLARDQTCSTSGPTVANPIRGLNGAVLASLRLPSPVVTRDNCNSMDRTRLKNLEQAKRGLLAWASVKLWEVIHRNNLEEGSRTQGTSVCSGRSGGSARRCVNASEARGWVADGPNLFERPPHYTGVGEGRAYFGQNELQGIFESNAWYHLNMVVNPGYRQTMPSHFPYTYSHVELLQDEAKVNQGYRFWATVIKQRQLQTNGRYGVEDGLDLRTAQPYIYYGTARNTTKTDAQASVGQPLWGRLAQAMVEDFVADANNATAQEWADANQNRVVQPRNSTDFSACSGVCTFDLGAYQGRNTYRVIPKLREIGVAESAIGGLIAWGRKTWPNGPWSRL